MGTPINHIYAAPQGKLYNALSGLELRKKVLHDVEVLLDSDDRFRNNIAYPKVGFKVSIVVDVYPSEMPHFELETSAAPASLEDGEQPESSFEVGSEHKNQHPDAVRRSSSQPVPTPRTSGGQLVDLNLKESEQQGDNAIVHEDPNNPSPRMVEGLEPPKPTAAQRRDAKQTLAGLREKLVKPKTDIPTQHDKGDAPADREPFADGSGSASPAMVSGEDQMRDTISEQETMTGSAAPAASVMLAKDYLGSTVEVRGIDGQIRQNARVEIAGHVTAPRPLVIPHEPANGSVSIANDAGLDGKFGKPVAVDNPPTHEE